MGAVLLLLSLVLLILNNAVISSALQIRMPPSVRWNMGGQQGEDSLKTDCLQSTQEQGATFCWEPTIVDCDYRLGVRIFDLLADMSTSATTATTATASSNSAASLWLPKFEGEQSSLNSLIQILNDNSKRFLGGIQVSTTSWPKTPATKIDFIWTTNNGGGGSDSSPREQPDEQMIEKSIKATERWVDDILCGMNLCPYTYSMERAPVGLESIAGVEEGPIGIRHSFSSSIVAATTNNLPPPAIILANAFWKGVQELAERPQNEVSTLLIIAPIPYYDVNFVEFVEVFDQLLEPTIQATNSQTIVGRAIFHPTYNSSLLSFTTDDSVVLPGHALPAKMVEGFIDRYLIEEDDNDEEEDEDSTTTNTAVKKKKKKKPDLDSIALANDAVRWTPHATINLLRRSQLSAAKEAEASSSTKRPNWIYARNVLRILKSDIISSSESSQS